MPRTLSIHSSTSASLPRPDLVDPVLLNLHHPSFLHSHGEMWLSCQLCTTATEAPPPCGTSSVKQSRAILTNPLDGDTTGHAATQAGGAAARGALVSTHPTPVGAQAAVCSRLHPAMAGSQSTFLGKQAFKLYQRSVYHFQSLCRNSDRFLK
jgi:hypothetical protein